MTRKVTITLDEEIYQRLYAVAGRRRISRTIESLIRPHLIQEELSTAYERMAQDEAREAEALEWLEGVGGDVADESG